MELEQSWEALDTDDSDIPTLLRPCKRRRTLTIPGPAKSVQSAILRKTLDRLNHNSTDISTQDYVLKAVDDTPDFDDDFTHPPWLSALQFLGVGEGEIPTTPISSIKRFPDVGEAHRVVAVIKSCTASGLGGLMLTLKDPTGTVGATIHHKVLCESEFRKNIAVGSVLILEKVAIFSPVRSTQYLNIVLRNLVKVFSPERDSLSAQTNADNTAHNTHLAAEYNEKAITLEKTFTIQSMEFEDHVNKKRVIKGNESLIQKKNIFHVTSQPNCRTSLIQKQNLFPITSQPNGRTSSNISATTKRAHSKLSQDPCHETPVDESDKRAIEGDIISSIRSVANSGASKGTDDKVQGTKGADMEGQSLILKSSLPQWTDEQLDELFADDEYGGSLC